MTEIRRDMASRIEVGRVDLTGLDAGGARPTGGSAGEGVAGPARPDGADVVRVQVPVADTGVVQELAGRFARQDRREAEEGVHPGEPVVGAPSATEGGTGAVAADAVAGVEPQVALGVTACQVRGVVVVEVADTDDLVVDLPARADLGPRRQLRAQRIARPRA